MSLKFAARHTLLMSFILSSSCAVAAQPAPDAAWISRFVRVVTDPALLHMSASDVTTMLGPVVTLAPDATSACNQDWSSEPGAAGPAVSASLNLLGTAGPGCTGLHFGILMVLLTTEHVSDDAQALADGFNAKFGAAASHQIGHHTDQHWQITPHAALELSLSSDPLEAGQIMVRLAQAP